MISDLGYGVQRVEPSPIAIERAKKPYPAPVPKEGSAWFRRALQEARSARKPIVIDFWASWCGPCLKLRKMMEEPDVAKALHTFQVILVDLDANPALASVYGVQTIPDVFFVDEAGLVVDRLRSFEEADGFLDRLRRVTQSTPVEGHEKNER